MLTRSKMHFVERDNSLNTTDFKDVRIFRDYLSLKDKKISFFIYILDYEILTDTSEIYDPLWNKVYSSLLREILATNHDITSI